MKAFAVISSLLAVFRSPLGPHACDLNIHASLNTPDDPRGSSGGREEGKEAEGKALRGRRETKRRRKQGMKGASWLAGWLAGGTNMRNHSNYNMRQGKYLPLMGGNYAIART